MIILFCVRRAGLGPVCWPIAETVQIRMLAQFVRVEGFPSETADVWNHRRMRSIAGIARNSRTWGRIRAQRILVWADHLKRPGNAASIAAALVAWHDSVWLETRQRDSNIGCRCCRPGARSAPGAVLRRWDEALGDAEAFLYSGVNMTLSEAFFFVAVNASMYVWRYKHIVPTRKLTPFLFTRPYIRKT